MELSDLFVSHKQVEPVIFSAPTTYSTLQPIYLNLDRAQKATTSDVESTKTETSEPEVESTSWRVAGYTKPEINSTNITPTSSSRWVSPYKNDRNKWISDMTAAYKRAGLNDKAVKNLIAKNALESSWGTSAQGDFNFGNITTGSSWGGRFVNGGDHDANGDNISQKFRAYNSLDDFVSDEIQFLTRLYDFKADDDFDTFIGKLQGNNSGKRRYAADKSYSQKVKRVYNSI